MEVQNVSYIFPSSASVNSLFCCLLSQVDLFSARQKINYLFHYLKEKYLYHIVKSKYFQTRDHESYSRVCVENRNDPAVLISQAP